MSHNSGPDFTDGTGREEELHRSYVGELELSNKQLRELLKELTDRLQEAHLSDVTHAVGIKKVLAPIGYCADCDAVRKAREALK
jgi:hypothetical protein